MVTGGHAGGPALFVHRISGVALALVVVTLLASGPSLALDPEQITKVVPPAWFSRAAVDGDTILINSRRDRFHQRDGEAYLFQPHGAGWALQATLEAGDDVSPGLRDEFGMAGDLDGDTVAVGSWFNSAEEADRAVFVFVRDGDGWQRQAVLRPADSPTGESFLNGDVAIEDDTLVLGASDADGGLGAAYVFVRTDGSWSQQAKLIPAERSVGQNVGLNVIVQGNTVVTGNIVFERDGGTWNEHTRLPRVVTNAAIDGDTLLVGEPGRGDPNDGTAQEGQVFLFEREGDTWQEQAELVRRDPHPGEGFGSTVALEGNRALVGAPGDSLLGATYLFERNGNTWTQEAKILRNDANTLSGGGDVMHVEDGIAYIAGTGESSGVYLFSLERKAALLCPGSVDGDHVTDLAVVDPHDDRVVVKNVNSVTLNAFALAPFFELVDATMMSDTNTNGSPELAVLGWRPAPHAGDTLEAVVHDLTSGGLLSTSVFVGGSPTQNLTVLPDRTDDGIEELALTYRSRSQVNVRIHDGLAGSELAWHEYTSWFRGLEQTLVFPDRNGNGHVELAVLGQQPSPDASDQIEIRDSDSGELIDRIWLGTDWEVRDQVLVSDNNGNGSPEVAVLRVSSDGDGASSVVIRDTLTKRRLRDVRFNWNFPPTHLLTVADLNGNGSRELVVFGRRADGAEQRAMIRDSRTGQWLNMVPFGPRSALQDVAVCGDFNGNDADDLIMLGRRDGELRAIVKDSATGERLRVVTGW